MSLKIAAYTKVLEDGRLEITTPDGEVYLVDLPPGQATGTSLPPPVPYEDSEEMNELRTRLQQLETECLWKIKEIK